MTEQITDTDRINFIQAHDCEVGIQIEPHCKCGSCWAWCVEIDDKRYFGDGDLRGAIDEAIKDCKCIFCKHKRKVK
jgi:hypothetical protein